MTVLETVTDRQAKWSATADALKGTVDQARRRRGGLRTGVIVRRSRGRILSTIVKAFLPPKTHHGSPKWTKMNQVAK
jgi:hypothetical protein